MSKLFVGIDIGGTNIEFAFLKDGVKHRMTIPTNSSDQGSHIIPEMASLINEYIGNNNCELLGIGVAVPGVVTAEGYTRICVSLHWENFNIRDEIKKYFDVPVYIVNDANAAALGEKFYGEAQNSKNSITITLGTGIGGGIILNGDIYTGSHDISGEIGHMQILSDSDTYCPCGGKKCLETYVSRKGFERQIGTEVSVKEIFEYAKNDNPYYVSFLRENFKHLAKVLLNLSIALDIETIVIGGGFSNAGSYLSDLIFNLMKGDAPSFTILPQVVTSTLKEDAGVLGVLGYVKEKENGRY